jgi:hypothetical protein
MTDSRTVITTTTASYTQPSVSSTVTVSVADSSAIDLGEIMLVLGGGYYSVASKPSLLSLTLLNLGYTGAAAVASTVASGSSIVLGAARAAVSDSTASFLNGAIVPVAGALTTGNTLQVIGASELGYAPVNLAGGSAYVAGALPAANQAVQTMLGDVTGTTAAAVVGKLLGKTLEPLVGTAGAADDGKVLAYDFTSDQYHLESPVVGPSGPAGPPGGSAGRRYYLDLATASSIGGAYKVAGIAPAATAETNVAQANTGTADTLVATFATVVGQPGTLELPLGTATRFIYAKVSGGVGRIKCELYKRTSGGTETLLRTGYSPDFSATVPTLIEWQFIDANAYALLADDRIVFKLYTARVSGGGGTVTITLYFNGTEHASSIETTILNTTTTGGLIRTMSSVKTGAYQCLSTDYHISTDCTSSSFTVTLLASPETGREYTINDAVGLCGTPYRVTISGGAKNINGFGTSMVMASGFFSVTLRYNGTIWNIV